jgi:3-hydroxymyristoyl/3-hydroxydecanoyl-(acyl carrier protein) dehydratase
MRPTQDAQIAVRAAVASDGRVQGSVIFPADLPVFSGHFPGAPLVPGVYILAAIAEVARRAGVARGEIHSVERAKWSAPAYPDQELRITLTTRVVDAGWRVDGEVIGPTGVCATARLLMKGGDSLGGPQE